MPIDIKKLIVFKINKPTDDGPLVYSLESTRENSHEFCETIVAPLIHKMSRKKGSLSSTSSCSPYEFDAEKDEDGNLVATEDLKLVTELLFEKTEFKTNAEILVERYVELPGSRPGLFIIAVANFEFKKVETKGLFAFALDFQHGVVGSDEDLDVPNESLVVPKLAKAFQYPFVDEYNPIMDQVKILTDRKSTMRRILKVKHMESTEQTLDNVVRECVKLAASEEGLSEEAIDRYFQVPLLDRDGSRQLGNSINEEDRISPVAASTMSHRVQMEAFDRGITPKLKLQIDQAKFEAYMGDLGSNFFIFKHKGSVFLLLRGDNFQVKGPLQVADFMKMMDAKSLLPAIFEGITSSDPVVTPRAEDSVPA
jgi:hypothetical protein